MVQIRDLCLSYPNDIIFDNVSLMIDSGEKIGLIGRNGSGKSTLLKIIMQQIEPESGSICIPKEYHIGYLQQHLQFTHDSVIEEVSSILPDERCHESWKGEKILMGLGFSIEEMLSSPSTLSGGFQIKINLAKILLAEPNLLLLDEPTNYLDIHSSKWLQHFLKKWQQALILITHDRMFMDSIISHSVYIHRSKLRKTKGKTAKIYTQVQQEEELQEQSRLNQAKAQQKTQEWINRVKAKSHMAKRAQSKQKLLDKQTINAKLLNIENLSFQFPYQDFRSREYPLQVDQLCFGYDTENLLINKLSFSLDAGEKICVIGKNGKGKSTLLKLIAQILQPISGSIVQHPKTTLGYFGQTNIAQLNPKYTILEQLEATQSNLDEKAIRSVCATMLFSDNKAKKQISLLSGGEKSRVMLGQLLLNPLNLLLLDEPTNHLDMESASALMLAIEKFPGTVIMVTHDEMYLRNIAKKLIIYDANNVFFYPGSYSKFLQEKGWDDL